MRLKTFSWIILALVLTAALPSLSRTNALPKVDPLAEQKAGTEDGPSVRMQRDMAKKANQARQADLKRDTEKAAQTGDRTERVCGQDEREHALAGRDQEGGGD